MTDVMSFTTPEGRLPGAPPRYFPQRMLDEVHERRIRDLELVCQVQQEALNYLLVSLTASHSRDLKTKIWPRMHLADDLLSDG